MTYPARQPLAPHADKPTPWWRVGMVWLVISGPLTVVVASFVSAALAIHGADEVLVETPSARIVPTGGQATGETPAMMARNHAATAR